MVLLREGTLGWGPGVPGFLCLAGTLGKASVSLCVGMWARAAMVLEAVSHSRL